MPRSKNHCPRWFRQYLGQSESMIRMALFRESIVNYGKNGFEWISISWMFDKKAGGLIVKCLSCISYVDAKL